MIFVCKETEPEVKDIRPEDAIDKAFDPSSRQPIIITDQDGHETEVAFADWIKKLDTNGRGGT